MLADDEFDLVLMDVQMPRLDGYADHPRDPRRARRPGRRVPVIAMTAAAVEGERERCLAAGMDDFLTKPVDPAALAGVLDRWTERRTTPQPGSVRTVTDDRDELLDRAGAGPTRRAA